MIKFKSVGKGSMNAVCLGHPDGYYLTEMGDKLQVVVIGPMPHSPFEILLAINEAEEAKNPDASVMFFEIENVSVLGKEELDEVTRKIHMQRGFFSIEMRRCKHIEGSK
jgi:hypothetical protein